MGKADLELLGELEESYLRLPGYVRAQISEIIVPIIGLLQGRLVKEAEQERRRLAALAHLDKTGAGLREKTALGIFLTGGE